MSLSTEQAPTENGLSVSEAFQVSPSLHYPPTVHLIGETPSSTISARDTPAAGVGVQPEGLPFATRGFIRPGRGKTSTFNGFLTPLMALAMIKLQQAMVRFFGEALSIAIQTAFIHVLFFMDYTSPIAWGKCLTWYFHPGRYKASWRRHWIQNIFIRIMFLITGLINAFIQYSGIILTPALQFHNGVFMDAVSDTMSDGTKYSCFTNHIIQTIFLYNPGGKFGRTLLNASRLYMEDVLFVSCLTSIAISILIEATAVVKFLYGVYTVFVWTDFILMGLMPRNIPRVIIAKWSSEVTVNTQVVTPAEPPAMDSSTAEEFIHTIVVLIWYLTFIVANAFLCSNLYGRIANIISAFIRTLINKPSIQSIPGGISNNGTMVGSRF